MKNIFLILGFFLIFSLSACKLDDLLEDYDDGYFMKATINSKKFQAKGKSFCNYSSSFGLFIITGGNLEGESINITLRIAESKLKTETYPFIIAELNGVQTNNIATYGKDSESYTTAQNQPVNNGSITITKYDKEKEILEGFFSFRAKDLQNPQNGIVVNDGKFSCKKF